MHTVEEPFLYAYQGLPRRRACPAHSAICPLTHSSLQLVGIDSLVPMRALCGLAAFVLLHWLYLPPGSHSLQGNYGCFPTRRSPRCVVYSCHLSCMYDSSEISLYMYYYFSRTNFSTGSTAFKASFQCPYFCHRFRVFSALGLPCSFPLEKVKLVPPLTVICRPMCLVPLGDKPRQVAAEWRSALPRSVVLRCAVGVWRCI